MKTLTPTKIISLLMLLVLLNMTVDSVCASAHPMPCHATTAGEQASNQELSAPHKCPCAPLEQHNGYDDCNACLNCTCHALLAGGPLQINYNPTILALHISDPFKFLPEVFYPKFIPPQIPA